MTYLSVKKDGMIDINQFKKVICKDTGIVSVMAVNNEIGVFQLVSEFGEICQN